MVNLMLDLETMDTAHTAAIVSIGAVMFDETGIGETFYKTIHLESNIDFGRTIGAKSVLWWLQQSEEARKEIYSPANPVDLPLALMDFRSFFSQQGAVYVWGNGADFDNMILGNAYDSDKLQRPWSYSKNRCYRTLLSLIPGIHDDPYVKQCYEERVAHNALADALCQAKVAAYCFKKLQ